MIESTAPVPVVAKVGLAMSLDLSAVLGDGKLVAPLKIHWDQYHVLAGGRTIKSGAGSVYTLPDANVAVKAEDKLLIESIATALQIWAKTKGL